MNKMIWAAGGGKGGTGKSFVAASLGLSLAGLSRDVILVDADLGAPNLHTFLGVKEPHPNLGDFLANQLPSLQEAVQPTLFDRLGLVRGSENTFFIANLNHYKKLKLLRHIKHLQAGHIVLDLGPGTSYNSLDFFISADRPLLVLTPEPTAIENGYYFLKSCILRILKMYIEHFHSRDILRRLIDQIEKNSHSLYAFFQTLIEEDKEFSQILYRALRNFKPFLIMNKARNERDMLLGRSIADVTRKHLLIDLGFLGAVPYDPRIHGCLVNKIPFVSEYPGSGASAALQAIAEKLLESQGSAERAADGL